MKIIFCLSYLEIPETITIIEKSGDNFLIVTSKSNIRKFFSMIYSDDKIMLLETKVSRIANPLLRKIEILLFIFYNKKNAWPRLKHVEGCDIFFSAVSSCELETWLIKKLSKKNMIYYKPEVRLHINPRYTLHSIMYVLVMRLIFNIRLIPIWDGNTFSYTVEKYFYEHLKANKYNLHADTRILGNILGNYINNKEVLLLIGGTIEGGYVEECEYITKMDRLIDLLSKKYGFDKLVVKVHPSYINRYSKENDIDSIPNYIPAVLIYPFFNTVIGYNTAGLFEAANVNKIALSLLRYMSPKSQLARNNFINYLNNHTRATIYFPKNLEEIEAVLEKAPNI